MERTLNHLQPLKLPFGDVLIKLIISFLLFKKETHLEFLILGYTLLHLIILRERKSF